LPVANGRKKRRRSEASLRGTAPKVSVNMLDRTFRAGGPGGLTPGGIDRAPERVNRQTKKANAPAEAFE